MTTQLPPKRPPQFNMTPLTSQAAEVALDKALGILVSKRMLVAMASGIIQLFGEYLGLEAQVANYFVGVLLAWAAGDAMDATGNLLLSRRFWMAASAVAAGIAAQAGIIIPAEALGEVLLPIAAAIVTASYRPVQSLSEKTSGTRRLLHEGQERT